MLKIMQEAYVRKHSGLLSGNNRSINGIWR